MTDTNMIADVTLRVNDRLILAPLRLEDAPVLHAAVQDPEIHLWLPLPRPYPLERAVAFCGTGSHEIRTAGRGLVRALRVDDRFAGIIDAKRIDWRAKVSEIGYWTAPEARGKGHMTAAVTAFAAWLLTTAGFERIELRVATQNKPSLRVAEKAQFHFEGVARNAGFTHAGRVDLAIYAKIRDDLAGPDMGVE